MGFSDTQTQPSLNKITKNPYSLCVCRERDTLRKTLISNSPLIHSRPSTLLLSLTQPLTHSTTLTYSQVSPSLTLIAGHAPFSTLLLLYHYYFLFLYIFFLNLVSLHKIFGYYERWNLWLLWDISGWQQACVVVVQWWIMLLGLLGFRSIGGIFLGAKIGEISVFRSRFSWVYVTGFYGFRFVQIKVFFLFW